MIESSDAAEILARALNDDRLVALVGASASARYVDGNGRSYPGLPTPTELVQIASDNIGYIKPEFSFNEVFDLIKEREGRAQVEQFLLQYYKIPKAFDIPPCHQHLAWLPFSQYITSNYDQFIERALEKEGRRPLALIDNSDVPRLQQLHTPVVKYHGCVSRSYTLVAASNEYELLQKERGLIRNHISATLAGKNLLVVGHGLADSDLSAILTEIVSDLGDYAPKIYVLRPIGHDGVIPDFSHPYEVIFEDLTQFLARLLHEFRKRREGGASVESEASWFKSGFFSALKKAAVLPSETQVIDAFLAHLKDEIAARPNVSEVLIDASAAVESALQERPNYGALRRTWRSVESTLAGSVDSGEAERRIGSYIADRLASVRLFNELGSNLIKSNERILLYSQSQRVLQTLRGVPVGIQKTVHLFVSECRPKSPHPFQDAAATCAELADTHFKITVCPDVVGLNLLATHQIDRVLLGTHALYKDLSAGDSAVHSFVNTCGANSVCILAEHYNIPVTVIGEPIKIEDVTRSKARDHLHPKQENDLQESARVLKSLATKRGAIDHLNIGYDLVTCHSKITVATPGKG
ncbi:MAG: SIR2 family protein [Candidatus Pacebacteria bacterium]|nr:SIR2 family protein [Candidatus Paceibacterota bacterium]